MKIMSGGQTGVDRAALDAAASLSIPSWGWCPKGRLAEDGLVPSSYGLQETPTESYSERTQWNVRDSDGHLVLTWGDPQEGTKVGVDYAVLTNKPLYIVNMEQISEDEFHNVHEWLRVNSISTLCIGGPRESLRPGVVYRESYSFLIKLLGYVVIID